MSMDDDELDAIRRRKLAEYAQAQDQAAANAQARENALAQRQLILRQILTPEARERLGRIELAYPELTESIESQLIALAQSGPGLEVPRLAVRMPPGAESAAAGGEFWNVQMALTSRIFTPKIPPPESTHLPISQ